MNERSHLSIGEVLNLLQEEFPDITISKIRFLESQGLLDPERTPSGYRKFYDGDIERLRWILRQQRENFLPLKVIKDRLAAGELDDPGLPETAPASVGSAVTPASAPSTGPAPGATGPVASTAAPTSGATPPPAPAASTTPSRPEPARTEPARAAATPAATPSTGPASRPATGRPETATTRAFDAGATSVSLSVEELCSASGLTPREVGDLERFGLLATRSLGNTTYYDDDALIVARVAATFLRHGVEPRHLRMYKIAAEREAGVLEQLVLPMLKQRNPGGRRQAVEVVGELAELGAQLRMAMLRQSVREYLGPA